MNRELILEYTPDMIRAAVMEDGRLCEIHRERVHAKKLTESLFLGCVQAIRPSVCAAFVDIGEALNAFLPIAQGSKFRCGDFVIVQGTAMQAVDTKGLRVSDTVNLAGKWLVLVPGGQGVHLSKKIKDPELRAALCAIAEPLCPQGCGLIIRTASSDVSEEAIKSEVQELEQRWASVRQKAAGMTKPGILYEPPDLADRLVRDIGGTLTRIVVNDRDAACRLEKALECGWVKHDATIEFFSECSALLSDVYLLDAQVDKALKKRVWLDCGGYLVFDACEALTVIDVNSGKMTLGRDTEETAFKVNLEAAEEIARQLRLRDIGGIVIVDYIDMRSEEHRNLLLQAVQRGAQSDRAQVVVGGMTRFGLVEMTRKRRGEQLDKALQTNCRVCGGDGRFLSAEETAFRALRQARRLVLAGQRGPFMIRCAAQVAAVLKELTPPDTAHVFYVLAEAGRHAERFEINQMDVSAPPPGGAVQMKKG